MAAEPLQRGVWWNTPGRALLPQVARVDSALGPSPAAKQTIYAVRRAPPRHQRLSLVSILIKAHAEQRSLDRCTRRDLPVTSDGSGHRPAAVLHTPALLLRGGFRGHPATRLQTRVDLAFFDGRNPLSDTTDVTSGVSDVADDAGTATATKRRRGGTGLSAMLLPELQSLAASLGISGTGRMRKGGLQPAISGGRGG